MRILYREWDFRVDEDTCILSFIDQWAIHRPAVLLTKIELSEIDGEIMVNLIPLKRAA